MRLAAAILLGAAAVAAQQTPPRDLQRTAPAGTASISGVIEIDDAQHKPLRRAKVMLNSPDLPLGRTVVTNDDGTFVFDRLPAGRFTLAAMKDGYVMMGHGARRGGRPGRPVPLASGESKRIVLRLPRGAVITGTIVDSEGQPSSGVRVTASTYVWGLPAAAGPRLVTAGVATSDDRGVYRIFGVSQGDYVIAAAVASGPPPGFVSTAPIEVISDAEIRRALAGPRTSSAPGRVGSEDATPPAEAARRTVTLSPVYFPGVTTEARATTVTVGAGEERTGIDLQLQYVPTTTIRVTLAAAGGATSRVFLETSGQPITGIVATATGNPEGRITFNNVRPGSYRLIARVPLEPGPGSQVPSAPAPALWASSEVVVNGEETIDAVLTPQAPLTLSGQVVFEGSRPALPIVPGLKITLPAGSALSSMMPSLPPVQLEAGGRFRITEVPPGPYRLGGTVPGIRTAVAGWWLRSIAVGGRDVLDGTIDLRQSVDDAVITFTDRATELAGKVTDAKGNAAADCNVVIFTTDSTGWFVSSRRVAAVRSGSDGRYTVSNLPPGDYFVTASDDVVPGEWNDPSLLQRLARGAVRILFAGFEKKVQDLIVDRP